MKLSSREYNELTSRGLSSELYGDDMSPFGQACFDDNMAADLMGYATDTPDTGDMSGWNIDETEWRNGQEEALQLAMHLYEQKEA